MSGSVIKTIVSTTDKVKNLKA